VANNLLADHGDERQGERFGLAQRVDYSRFGTTTALDSLPRRRSPRRAIRPSIFKCSRSAHHFQVAFHAAFSTGG